MAVLTQAGKAQLHRLLKKLRLHAADEGAKAGKGCEYGFGKPEKQEHPTTRQDKSLRRRPILTSAKSTLEALRWKFDTRKRRCRRQVFCIRVPLSAILKTRCESSHAEANPVECG
jgi:hypothetical protein